MSDGWTGINVNEVTQNLANFESEANAIASDFRTAFEITSEDLYQYWASEKAVEFNKNIINVGSAYNLMVGNIYVILNAAGTAAVEMAKANGEAFTNPYTEIPKDKLLTSVVTLRSDRDGVQGMNITAAKVSFDSFVDTCVSVLDRLSGLPTAFGLYDPAGELQNAYKNKIAETQSLIVGTVKESVTAISTAFENEVNQVEFGKRAAEEVLTGSAVASEMESHRTTLGEQLGGRYSNEMNDYVTKMEKIPELGKAAGEMDVIPGMVTIIGGLAKEAGATAEMVANEAINTALVVPDTLTYLANGLLDIGSSNPGVKTGADYFKEQIATDYSENWNSLINASNFWEGAAGVAEGLGRSFVDSVQTAINAGDVAINWLGEQANGLINAIGNLFW